MTYATPNLQHWEMETDVHRTTLTKTNRQSWNKVLILNIVFLRQKISPINYWANLQKVGIKTKKNIIIFLIKHV